MFQILDGDKMFSQLKLILDVTAFVVIYLGGVAAFNIDTVNALTIVGASVAGALVLVYFRRDRDYKEIFFKAGCASISGVVFGSVISKYYALESSEYIFATYFFASMLSVFFLKGLLAVTEQNATGVIISILQRFQPVSGNLRISPVTDIPNSQDEPPVIEAQTTIKVQKDGEAKVIADEKKTL
jgi:hypothetical protein